MGWIICDIDDTLTDISHRLHLVPKPMVGMENHNPVGFDKEWDAFNRAAASDPVKPAIQELLWMGRRSGHQIMLFTGRFDRYKRLTMSWLLREDVPWEGLAMRCEGDYRSDVDVKREMFDRHFPPAMKSQVLFVLEDRDKLVEMWRSIGLTCLQVSKGRY